MKGGGGGRGGEGGGEERRGRIAKGGREGGIGEGTVFKGQPRTR